MNAANSELGRNPLHQQDNPNSLVRCNGSFLQEQGSDTGIQILLAVNWRTKHTQKKYADKLVNRLI